MTDPFVRPDVAAFLHYYNRLPGPRMHQLDAAGARALYRGGKDLTDLPVGALAVIRDLAIPVPHGTLPARLFDARETRLPGPAVVFCHGGGFVIGDLDTHAGFCAEIARALDLPVVAVDYRLAPEAPWPAAPDDAEAAARWVAGSPAELGRTVTALVLAGDSAGGTLSITTAMALRDAPAAVPGLAQFAIYPGWDFSAEHGSFREFARGFLLDEPEMTWFGRHYAADPTHTRGVPKLGSCAGLPPAVVLTAGLDPIRDQGRAYAAALIAAGVPTVFREAAGNIHGFVTLRKAIPSSQGDVAGALAALKAVIAEAEAAQVMEQAA